MKFTANEIIKICENFNIILDKVKKPNIELSEF